MHGRLARAVGAAADAVEADARDVQPLDPGAVDERQAHDGGDLPQQAQGVDALPLLGGGAPGELNHPAELIADAVDEASDLAGGAARLGPEQAVELRALVAVAEPSLARSIDEKRHHHGGEQGDEVLSEQRAAGADGRRAFGRRPHPALPPPPHSITSSARARSTSGKAMPSALAAWVLITSSYRVGCCIGKSAGFSPRRMRST